MKTISYGKHKTQFPENLGDLTQLQLLQLAQVFTGNKNLVDAKVDLAYRWAPKVYKYNEERIKDTVERFNRTDIAAQKEILAERLEDCHYNRLHLSECANWITTPQVCDKWIIPQLSLKKWYTIRFEFMGPSLRFGNVQFWEWCRAEGYFSDYVQTDNRDSFNKFCACIYHPRIKGVRIPFEDSLVEDNHKLFSNLTPTQVFAIRLNYIAVKNWLRQVHPHLFKERTEEDGPEERQDMADLLLRHADMQKVHYKTIEKDPLLVSLKQLNNRAKDLKEKEEQKHD